MKPTDEMKEEIQHYLDIPSEMGILVRSEKVKQLLQSLISSEQAWKEEAEQTKKRLNRCIETSVDISVFNEAVELLKWIFDYTADRTIEAKIDMLLSSLGKENDNA